MSNSSGLSRPEVSRLDKTPIVSSTGPTSLRPLQYLGLGSQLAEHEPIHRTNLHAPRQQKPTMEYVFKAFFGDNIWRFTFKDSYSFGTLPLRMSETYKMETGTLSQSRQKTI